MCVINRFLGGMKSLYSLDDDAVSWLETSVTIALMKFTRYENLSDVVHCCTGQAGRRGRWYCS